MSAASTSASKLNTYILRSLAADLHERFKISISSSVVLILAGPTFSRSATSRQDLRSSPPELQTLSSYQASRATPAPLFFCRCTIRVNSTGRSFRNLCVHQSIIGRINLRKRILELDAEPHSSSLSSNTTCSCLTLLRDYEASRTPSSPPC
jgi:hypothetical protein